MTKAFFVIAYKDPKLITTNKNAKENQKGGHLRLAPFFDCCFNIDNVMNT
jgi:hypothetical protein